MLYTKTNSKRYTMMCKDFDKEFYLGPDKRNDAKLYKDLYLLFYMFACKGSYFKKFQDINGYAQYSATKIYARYLKKEKKGLKIKSVLNYVKGCKGHLKIDYQNETFQQISQKDDDKVTAYIQVFRQNLQDGIVNEMLKQDIEDAINNFSAIIKEVVEETPYRKDKVLIKNLYISSLLTLLNATTLRNSVFEKIYQKDFDCGASNEFILKQFQRERDEEPILWNLKSKFSDTVKLIVNKARARISVSINKTIAENNIPDDMIDAIILNTHIENNLTDDRDANMSNVYSLSNKQAQFFDEDTFNKC